MSYHLTSVTVSSIQSLSHVRLFVTPWTAACQASLSITNSQSLLKLMPIELVMPSNHLILCHPLLFPPSTFPSIRVFSKESALHIRWPKYWCFSFSISPSNEYVTMVIIKKSTNNNVGKGVEKKEHSCTIGGNVNWYNHYGRCYGDSLKSRNYSGAFEGHVGSVQFQIVPCSSLYVFSRSIGLFQFSQH